MEYCNTRTLDKNSKRESRKNYMTLKQKLEVVDDINETGLFLLEFYYMKVGLNYTYDDENVGVAIRWKSTKVQRYRLELERYGYFKQIVAKAKDDVIYQTLLGHERWNASKQHQDDIEENNEKVKSWIKK